VAGFYRDVVNSTDSNTHNNVFYGDICRLLKENHKKTDYKIGHYVLNALSLSQYFPEAKKIFFYSFFSVLTGNVKVL
jgi:hypothetical protein